MMAFLQNRPYQRYCVILLGSLLLLAVFLWTLDKCFPLALPDEQQSFARVVTDRRGQPLRAFADTQGVWRYPVDHSEVSPYYLEALLAYEDRWFYQHPGVNPLALARALTQRVRSGYWVSGGSTLSMQVARLLHPHSKTIRGKSHQVLRALQLEWHFNKTDILNLYLNYAPFGGPVEGVQAASFTYFGKSAKQLSRAEAALLAVLPQAPSYYRPDRYPQRAKEARNKVLERLAQFEIWDNASIDEAKQEPIIAQYNVRPLIAPLLSRRLVQQFPDQALLQTTLDLNLQRNVEQTVTQYMQQFAAKTSAAVLLVDNKDMSVLSYVGSADFGDPRRFGHVDMITAIRSPGSTLKPFLYGLALDTGLIHEQSLLMDIPSEFAGYQPENFEEGFNGPVAARDALRRSLNVPAVQLLDALGPETFYANLASAGLLLKLPSNAKPNLSLILGGAGSNLQSLTQSFAALGRGGLVQPLKFLHNHEANVDRRLMSPEAAWIIANSLSEGQLNRFGHQPAMARGRQQIAFKTGTSYGYRDAWVLATTAKYTVGVWVGRPDGTALTDNYGRHTAVPLLQRILNLLPQNQLQLPEKPARVTRDKICWPLGSLQQLQQAHWCMRTKQAWLIDNQAPVNTFKDPLHRDWAGTLTKVWLNDKDQRVTPGCGGQATANVTFALWPQSLHPWLPKAWRRDSVLPALAETCEEATSSYQLEIDGIEPGSELYPPPGSNQLPGIQLSIKGKTGKVHWFLDGKWLANSETLDLVDLSNGWHEVSAMNQHGQMTQLNFRVGGLSNSNTQNQE